MFNEPNEKQTWKKLPVKRDRIHEPLVDKLTSNKEGNSALFPYIKDLMVFAAMVGFSKSKRKPIGNETVSIILETYETDRKDAFIYLIALMTEKNGACLKNENLLSSIKIFEEYCNAGLAEIQFWFDENPGDHLGIDTLSDKIFEQVIRNEQDSLDSSNPESLEVEF